MAYPPFCKFNFLNFLPHAHVLKRRIDPDRLTLFLLQRSVNRKLRDNSGSVPLLEKYYMRPSLSPILKARAVSILQGLLISCNQMSAEYLFMTDKLYDVRYDTGDKVIQCGRHNDIFKLWLQWRAKVQNPLYCYRKPLRFLVTHRFSRILSSDIIRSIVVR